jgi:membrane-associated phospholipid phosphatase
VAADEAFFEIITKFGDSRLLLPASVGLCLGMFVTGARQSAAVFACAWTACICATSLAKILSMACGELFLASLHSPSGHASLSSMFYLTLGLTAAKRNNPFPGRAFLGVCIVLVALVAISRVVLDAHSVAETLIGLAIGLASFGAFWRYSQRHSPISTRALLIGAAPVLLAYAAVGVSAHAEERLERIAAWLARHWGC